MNDQRNTKSQPISGNGERTAASDRSQDWGPFLKRVVVFGAAGSIVVALMGLLGYAPGLGLLGKVREGYIPMAPSTAISFIVLGGILLAMTLRSLSGASLVLFGALVALVSLFGALEVAGHFTGRDLNFEKELVPAAGYLGEIPTARMSPSTGALFFLAGLAAFVLLLRVRTHSQEPRLGHWGGSLGCVVLGAGLIFCLAYLYGSPLLYGQGTTVPMALTTALAFLMLGAATVGVSGPDAIPVSLLAAARRAGQPLSARRRFLFLTLIMVGACAMVMAVMTLILYRHDIEEHRGQLQRTVQSQARLIEAVARYDANVADIMSVEDPDHDAFAATLSQIVNAHEHFEGFGETGEFTLARREGDFIVFVLRHRLGTVERPAPVAFDSELAEPMRLALEGFSGTVISLDYRGETVLAAHEPVAVLNLGMVAKIDLNEIRGPFIMSGLAAAAVALLVVLASTALSFRIANPIIARLEAYSRDLEKEIEERKQAEERLIESEQQLRSLAAHLASAREETMIAISRDLHDELGQILTALKMDAAWLNGKIPKEQQPLKEKAESIVGDLNDTIQVVRRITAQLRPVILDNQGLVPALRYEVQEFEKRTGIECSFTIEPPKLTTDKDHSTVFYRILQESLTNIKKHAQASKVVISLKADQDQLVLQVQDNGIGITKEQTEKTGSYGILGMRERVMHLAGEIKIQGVQGQGTQLSVAIPIKRKD